MWEMIARITPLVEHARLPQLVLRCMDTFSSVAGRERILLGTACVTQMAPETRQRFVTPGVLPAAALMSW